MGQRKGCRTMVMNIPTPLGTVGSVRAENILDVQYIIRLLKYCNQIYKFNVQDQTVIECFYVFLEIRHADLILLQNRMVGIRSNLFSAGIDTMRNTNEIKSML